MLESLLMQNCPSIGVEIFIWTYWTPCDGELARALAPFNSVLSIVVMAVIGLIVYKRKVGSKKTWKQIAKAEFSILKHVTKEPFKDAWSVMKDYQKASHLESNG